jgi:hypothetical protein
MRKAHALKAYDRDRRFPDWLGIASEWPNCASMRPWDRVRQFESLADIHTI